MHASLVMLLSVCVLWVAAFTPLIGLAAAADEASPSILVTVVSSDAAHLSIKRAELLPVDELSAQPGPPALRVSDVVERIAITADTRLLDASGRIRPLSAVRSDGSTLYRLRMRDQTAARLTEYRPKRRTWSPTTIPQLTNVPQVLEPPFPRIPAPGALRPYFATNAPHVSLLNPIASQPQAVKRGSKTYIAYEGPGRDPYVACWDEKLQEWDGPYRAGTNPQTWDTHGGPALFVDERGNVHVFFGSHHQPLLHVRTLNPGRIDAWTTLPSIQSETTYPKPMHTATGPLLLYRDRSSDEPSENLHWVIRGSEDDGDTWGPETELLSMAYPLSVYPTVAERPDGSIDLSWVDVDWFEYFDTDSWGRHNVYYAHRTPSGSWENAFGEELSLPIDRTTAEQKCLVTNTGTELTNQTIPGMGSDGRPRVLFTQGNDGSRRPYRFRFARATEGTWTIDDIAPTDHFYDSATWYSDDTGYTAFLTTGGAGPDGSEPNGVSGGRVSRWQSEDGGHWTRVEQVDPGAEGTLLNGFNFAGLQLVLDGDGQSRVAFQEWNLVSAPAAQGVYLWGDRGLKQRRIGPAVTRIGARDRYAQAAAVADQAFTAGANTVIVASGEDFADALVSGPFAAVSEAPILLTRRDALPDSTRASIRSLHAKSVIIIGGTSAVSASVERTIAGLGLSVERIAGRDRYETAALVAGRVFDKTSSSRALIASGEIFADGATAGAAGATSGDPILLVSASRVPPHTARLLLERAPVERIIVGGNLRIPQSVYEQLGGTERINGRDRYEVAAGMARWTRSHGALPYRTLVSTGADFPDCLSASVVAARLRGAMLLVPGSSLPTATAEVLAEKRDSTIDVFVYGGPVSVSDQTVEAIRQTLVAP